jgi:hypothetical protein
MLPKAFDLLQKSELCYKIQNNVNKFSVVLQKSDYVTKSEWRHWSPEMFLLKTELGNNKIQDDIAEVIKCDANLRML